MIPIQINGGTVPVISGPRCGGQNLGGSSLFSTHSKLERKSIPKYYSQISILIHIPLPFSTFPHFLLDTLQAFILSLIIIAFLYFVHLLFHITDLSNLMTLLKLFPNLSLILSTSSFTHTFSAFAGHFHTDVSYPTHSKSLFSPQPIPPPDQFLLTSKQKAQNNLISLFILHLPQPVIKCAVSASPESLQWTTLIMPTDTALAMPCLSLLEMEWAPMHGALCSL